MDEETAQSIRAENTAREAERRANMSIETAQVIRAQNTAREAVRTATMREETIQQRTRRHRNYMAGWNCDIDTFEPNTVQLCSLGEMNFRCIYCNALGFKSENQGTLSRPHFGKLCCKEGKTLLEPFPEPPNVLLNLLQNQDVLSKHYRENIRKFNSNLAMASIKYTDATV